MARTAAKAKTSGEENGKSEPGGTQAIDRALAVLMSFTRETPTRRVPELAELHGLTKSTVYRLLQALTSANLVWRDEDTATYRLGSSVLDLASCFLATLDLEADARPLLHAFATRFGESVNLAVLDRSHAVSVAQVRGSRTPQLVSRLGLRIPLYCSSTGKALLLDHSNEEIAELLGRDEMRALTPNTITDPAVFLARLERERRQGWTLNDEESEIGLRVVGAPVRDYKGEIVAAVSASSPTFRLPKNEVAALAKEVRALAADISAVLGHPRGEQVAGD